MRPPRLPPPYPCRALGRRRGCLEVVLDHQHAVCAIDQRAQVAHKQVLSRGCSPMWLVEHVLDAGEAAAELRRQRTRWGLRRQLIVSAGRSSRGSPQPPPRGSRSARPSSAVGWPIDQRVAAGCVSAPAPCAHRRRSARVARVGAPCSKIAARARRAGCRCRRRSARASRAPSCLDRGRDEVALPLAARDRHPASLLKEKMRGSSTREREALPSISESLTSSSFPARPASTRTRPSARLPARVSSGSSAPASARPTTRSTSCSR